MEDLLFLEGTAADLATDNRFDGLDKRIRKIEDLKKDSPERDGSLKRHSYLFPILTPILTAIGLVLSLVFGAFNSVFDGRIASKLNEPNGLAAQIGTLSVNLALATGELNAIRRLWEGQLKRSGELRPQQFRNALVRLLNVTFENCVFVVNPQEVLPDSGKRFIRFLLSGDEGRVFIETVE